MKDAQKDHTVASRRIVAAWVRERRTNKLSRVLHMVRVSSTSGTGGGLARACNVTLRTRLARGPVVGATARPHSREKHSGIVPKKGTRMP